MVLFIILILLAVSVCLPTWSSIVGYEMGDLDIVSRMKLGYPRFVFHPKVTQLFNIVKKPNGFTDCLLFLGRNVAEECTSYLEILSKDITCQMVRMNGFEFYGVFFNQELTAAAKVFWTHTGMGISSRFANAILSGNDTQSLVKNDSVVKDMLKERISSFVGSNHVYLFPSGRNSSSNERNGCHLSGFKIGLETLSGFKNCSVWISLCGYSQIAGKVWIWL